MAKDKNSIIQHINISVYSVSGKFSNKFAGKGHKTANEKNGCICIPKIILSVKASDKLAITKLRSALNGTTSEDARKIWCQEVSIPNSLLYEYFLKPIPKFENETDVLQSSYNWGGRHINDDFSEDDFEVIEKKDRPFEIFVMSAPGKHLFLERSLKKIQDAFPEFFSDADSEVLANMYSILSNLVPLGSVYADDEILRRPRVPLEIYKKFCKDYRQRFECFPTSNETLAPSQAPTSEIPTTQAPTHQNTEGPYKKGPRYLIVGAVGDCQLQR